MICDRTLYEQTPAMLQAIAPDGRIAVVSDQWLDKLGYSRQEVVGKPWQTFLAEEGPTERPVLTTNLPEVAANQSQLLCFKTRDGSLITTAGSVRWIRDEQDNLTVCAMHLVELPTAQPQAESALRQQAQVLDGRDAADQVMSEATRRRQREFQAIFEQSAVSMAQISLEGTYIQVNPAFCTLVGYAPQELIGEHYAKVTHPDDLADDIQFSQAVAEGEPYAHFFTKRFIRSDGEVRHVQVAMTAVRGNGDCPIFLASVYTDITDRIAADTALRKVVEGTASAIGESFFLVLAQKLSESLKVDHVLVNRLDGDIVSTLAVWSNGERQPDFTYSLSGTPCAHTVQQGIHYCLENVQAVFPSDRHLVELNAESYLGVTLVGENNAPLGEICAIHSRPIPELDNAIAILRIFAARAAAELERQQYNRALQESQTRLELILQNMPVLLDASDENGRLVLWNAECERVTGYRADEMVCNPDAFSLLYPDESYRQSMQRQWVERGNNYRNWEWPLLCKDGRQRIIAWSNVSDMFPIPGLGTWGVGVDVTDRCEAEAALRESEARFHRLAANMPGVIYRYHIDQDGRDRFSYLSAACLEILEIDPDSILQDAQRFWTLVHPDDSQGVRVALTEARSGRASLSKEFRILTSSGMLKWLQMLARPVAEAPDRWLWDGIIIDVTEQKATEQALRENETLNRAILNAIPDLLIRIHRDGTCLDMQSPDSFKVMCPKEVHIGRNVRDTLPHDVAEARLAAVQQALTTQEIQVCDYQISVQGYTRWEEARIVPLVEDEALILIRDIDERKRAEDEVRRLNQILESQNQQLEALVEQRTAELMSFMNALPDQIFAVDRATNVATFSNEGAARFANKAYRRDFEGRSVFDCFSPERAAYYDAQNQQVFATGKVLHVEESVETSQGTLYLDTYKIPLKYPTGEVYALIGTSRDITELVEARRQLETQAEQLSVANRELQSFSYSVSHDLRAPLRHINGFITALKQRLETTVPLDDKTTHYLSVIEKSSHRMGLLIDGLLALSRVGRRELDIQSVALSPLIEQSIALLEESDFDPLARVHIRVDDLPNIQGDAVLLQQVFVNLLSNAVKFSRDRAPAIIRVGQRQEDGVFFIQDNGVGFDMAYADKLFGPFQRLHTLQDFEGTGIGLAIVNRIIQRHGGNIWVESAPNRGTTFFFTLPQ